MGVKSQEGLRFEEQPATSTPRGVVALIANLINQFRHMEEKIAGVISDHEANKK